MRLLVISAICALAACSLYEGTSTNISRPTAPDAGNHTCGDGGGPLPDAGFYPDGAPWGVPDAGYEPDGGSYLPDAFIDPVDAGSAHGH